MKERDSDIDESVISKIASSANAYESSEKVIDEAIPKAEEYLYQATTYKGRRRTVNSVVWFIVFAIILFGLLNLYYFLVLTVDAEKHMSFLSTDKDNINTIKEIILNIYAFALGGIIGRYVMDHLSIKKHQ